MPRTTSGCAVGLLGVALAGLWGAWLTGHPDSRALDWVAGWPPAAPSVARFRALFGTAGADAVAEDRPAPRPVVVVVPRRPEGLDARPRVWVPEGTPVRSEPRSEAAVAVLLEATSNPAVEERRGDWFLIRRPGDDEAAGWVHLPGHDERQPPATVLTPAAPLPAAPPDPAAVAAARGFMKGGGREMRCGPYDLVTDAEPVPLVSLCELVVAPLEAAYRDAFGVEPIGEAAGVILLFAERDAFRRFSREVSGVRTGYAGHARAARGYVALPQGAAEQTVRTLVHELTHLIDRRALGPALPRWLAEGLADYLGDAAGPAGLETVRGVLGAEGEIRRLQGAYAAGLAPSLSRLVGLGADEFDGESPSYDYEQSAFFVRYLLSDGALALRFRRWLRTLAAGAVYEPESLRLALGAEWKTLDTAFEHWVRTIYLTPPPQTVRLSSG